MLILETVYFCEECDKWLPGDDVGRCAVPPVLVPSSLDVLSVRGPLKGLDKLSVALDGPGDIEGLIPLLALGMEFVGDFSIRVSLVVVCVLDEILVLFDILDSKHDSCVVVEKLVVFVVAGFNELLPLFPIEYTPVNVPPSGRQDSTNDPEVALWIVSEVVEMVKVVEGEVKPERSVVTILVDTASLRMRRSDFRKVLVVKYILTIKWGLK